MGELHSKGKGEEKSERGRGREEGYMERGDGVRWEERGGVCVAWEPRRELHRKERE